MTIDQGHESRHEQHFCGNSHVDRFGGVFLEREVIKQGEEMTPKESSKKKS